MCFFSAFILNKRGIILYLKPKCTLTNNQPILLIKLQVTVERLQDYNCLALPESEWRAAFLLAYNTHAKYDISVSLRMSDMYISHSFATLSFTKKLDISGVWYHRSQKKKPLIYNQICLSLCIEMDWNTIRNYQGLTPKNIKPY